MSPMQLTVEIDLPDVPPNVENRMKLARAVMDAFALASEDKDSFLYHQKVNIDMDIDLTDMKDHTLALPRPEGDKP